MDSPAGTEDAKFHDALAGLRNGDFSRLAPLFEAPPGSGPGQSQIVQWYEQGRFTEHRQESAEALACACFLGRVGVAEYLLSRGISPTDGMGTGMNAFHWAANRGQLEAVELLLRHRAPLDTRNMYGGTVLGSAVWAALHEPKPDHLLVLEALLQAGARLEEGAYPTGDARVDGVLHRFGVV